MIIKLTKDIPLINRRTLARGTRLDGEFDAKERGVIVIFADTKREQRLPAPMLVPFLDLIVCSCTPEEYDIVINSRVDSLPIKPQEPEIVKTQTVTPTSRKAKPAATAPPIAATPPSAPSSEVPHEVQELSVYQLDRHPVNRIPTQEDVAERAESLKSDGQLEPLVVRKAPAWRFQILSGETRWLAAQRLGWSKIKARVIICDDARALELLAAYNAHRRDLNAIQKANLILRLCDPKDKGGAGLTREAAGKTVGVGSGSAASNLVRLLQLPLIWQKRVEDGELPESYARLLVPYALAASVMDEIDNRYTSKEESDRECFNSRDLLEEELGSVVDDFTRRLDGEKMSYRYHYRDRLSNAEQGDYPCLLTKAELDQHRDKLDIVTIPITDGGGKPKEVEVATNLKAFDEMQIARIIAKVKANAHGKAKDAGAKADAGEKDPPKSKAELERAAKQRAEQLGRNICDWRERVLRAEIARAMGKVAGAKKPDPRVLLALMHFFADRFTHQGDIWEHLCETFGVDESANPYCAMAQHVSAGGDLIATLMGTALIACQHLIGGDKPAELSPETLDMLADHWEVTMEDAWRKLHSNKDPLLQEFFEMHRKGELQSLGKELIVSLADNLGKPQMIDVLLNRHAALPLPKCLQPEKKRETKKGGKRG